MKNTLTASLAAILLLAGTASAQSYYPSYSSGYAYGSSGSCPTITRDLVIGSRGADVSSLQSFLVSQNYPGSGSWMISGYFGNATAAALRNYQSQRNLAQTGIADGATRAAIAACASAYMYQNNNYYPNNQYPYYNQPYQNYPYYPNYPYGNRPYISHLSPSRGDEGDKIRIYGSGFSDDDNTVLIDGKRINNLDASADGTVIRFTVPRNLRSNYYNNCNYNYSYNYNYGYQYPCNYGSVLVSVINDDGFTSNAVPFTITSFDDNDGELEITDISGPSSREEGQRGTWDVTVDAGENPNITITVDWDDDESNSVAHVTVFGEQTYSFSHTYDDDGDYSINFKVRDGDGETDNETKTVEVNND